MDVQNLSVGPIVGHAASNLVRIFGRAELSFDDGRPRKAHGVIRYKKVGAAGGIALGLSHKTGKRVQTFIQAKYIRFSKQLDYLDMHFFMVGLSLKLSD